MCVLMMCIIFIFKIVLCCKKLKYLGSVFVSMDLCGFVCVCVCVCMCVCVCAVRVG